MYLRFTSYNLNECLRFSDPVTFFAMHRENDIFSLRVLGILIDYSKVNVIVAWMIPTDKTKVQISQVLFTTIGSL